MAIALRAGIELEANTDLSCRRVKLQSRYDVVQVEEGDEVRVALLRGSVPQGGCGVSTLTGEADAISM